jgi:SAM-dependent methyltransferase
MTHERTLNREYFETLYRVNPDPWNFASSSYEDQKYEATLGALSHDYYESAIEIGCSIGILTARLATRCGRLHAVDTSPTAVKSAKTNCRSCNNVDIHIATAPFGLPHGSYDLLLLSEVLYYLDRGDLQSLADWCLTVAGDGAEVILCHWLGPTDYPLSGALASDLFIEAMQARLELHSILHEGVYRLERIRLRPQTA